MAPIVQNLVFLSALVGATVSAKPHYMQSPGRVLQAATKRSDLARRSVSVETKYNTEISYTESESFDGREIFASQLQLISQKPVVNLEEIEHHLDDVKCKDGSIELRFIDEVVKRDALSACHGGLMITSHDGCNAEGERAVYSVTETHSVEGDLSLALAVVESEWKDAFSKIDISFGHTTESHIMRRHSDFKLRRRQIDATSTVPPVSIPSDAPPDKNDLTFNATSQLLDHTFNPAEFLSGVANAKSIPELPVEVGCNNCTTTGTVVLTQGQIQIDSQQIDLVPDFLQGGDDGKDLSSVITGGFFQVSANDLTAHIDLFARPKLSGSFSVGLPGIPILGFTIPGIGQAGAFFNLTMVADYLVTGGLSVNYGFDIVVPQNSQMKIDIANLEQSSMTGFTETKMTPIPFSANVTDIDVKLGLTLKPVVPIGFTFIKKMTADIAVSMNLPRLDIELKTQKDVDPACNAMPGTNSTAPAGSSNSSLPNPFTTSDSPILTAEDLTSVIQNLGPLVLIASNVSFSLDVGADFTFPFVPPPVENSINTKANIFETTFTIGTTCLAANKGYQTAAAAFSSATSSLIASKISATPSLAPSGTGSGGAVQTSPGQFFDSAAARQRALGGIGFGWQFLVAGIGFVAGMMVLL